MKKTTITFTTLPYRAAGTPGAGGKLRVSVFIAPRLWTTEPAEQQQILPLQEYPVFADWPAQVSGLEFNLSFAGGTTLAATPVSSPQLRSDLWAALFPPGIPVKPYRFENLANTPIETIDTAFLDDWLHDLYRRIGTDPAYGAGANKPSAESTQRDPGIQGIARPSEPEPPYEPPDKRRIPVHYAPEGPEEKGCLRGCLALFFDLLDTILNALGLGKPFNIPHVQVQPPGGHGPIGPIRRRGQLPGGTATPHPMSGPAHPLSGGPVHPGTASAAKAKFDAVTRFIQPFEVSQAAPPPLTEEQLAKLLDFHEAVGLAADYPSLLRALGLVVDLEVDWPAGLPATGMVWLKVPAVTGAVVHSLRTHYAIENGHFLAAPRPPASGQSETRGGLLRLSDDSRYRVIQTDVVGASVKVQNMATAAVANTVPGLQPANPKTEETLPALRSSGFSIVQRDLATQLMATYVGAAGLNNALAAVDGEPPAVVQQATVQVVETDELWAEDLIVGYRLDVRDLDSASQQWRSLHRRTGTCRFTRPEPDILFPVEDEGYVQLATTEPISGGTVQRVHDAIVTWTGWSLNAVRPGKSLVESDEPGQTAQAVPNEDKTAFKMVASVVPVSGSLPRLRFGHRYHLRVRTVDLAGNSVFGPEDPEFQQAGPDDSGPHVYRRFEPVPSPAVVLKEKPVEGESVERLVVRSAVKMVVDPDHVNRLVTQRHIVPPKSSQLLAEYHSQFDGADGKLKPDQATYDLAALESGTLTLGWMPSLNKLVLLHGTDFMPDGDGNKDPTFWQTHDAFPLSYLPDELARKALLLNLPGLPPNAVQDGVNRIPFDGEWPRRLPFRLKVLGIAHAQAPQPPKWTSDPDQPETRVLEVELPQGTAATVRVSSSASESDLGDMGVWAWETEPPSGNHAAVSAATAQGRNWLIMPYREIQLVHATQKPLEMPTLSITQVTKAEGDTAAHLAGSAGVHAPTTGKIDVLATWTDPDDDLAKTAPGERKSLAALGEFHVTSPLNVSVPVTATHNLGDTKYHHVTYVARGATRFREYMPPALLVPGQEDKISTPTMAEIQAGSLTTVSVNDVPNSARPLAPSVAYVVPSFGRVQVTKQQLGGIKVDTRVRRGNGLRVYLRRPWFSSGANERLGVVYQAPGAVPASAARYLTEWANDPIWVAPAADLTPGDANFANPVAGPRSVKLEETGDTVRVTGYAVEYDALRGLWFADVEFAGLGTYMPMVRLALARFQPISVGDAFISRVVRAEFVQPLPDRTLTISRPEAHQTQITVTLEGMAPTMEAGKVRPVQAWVEQLEFPALGDLGWVHQTADNFQPEVLPAGSALWKCWFDMGLLVQGKYRIVVQEIEPITPSGAIVWDPEGGTSVTPSGAVLGRTVYADTWEWGS